MNFKQVTAAVLASVCITGVTAFAETETIQTKESQAFECIQYDHDAKKMTVTFKADNSKCIVYEVPEELWNGVATRHGLQQYVYYWENIRKNHVFGQIPGEPKEKPQKAQQEAEKEDKPEHGYVAAYNENHEFTGYITYEAAGINHENSDYDDTEYLETTDSTCFSEIMYDYVGKQLYVRFRENGYGYIYSDIPYEIWYELRDAESKGGYYNSDIKGQYRSQRVDW